MRKRENGKGTWHKFLTPVTGNPGIHAGSVFKIAEYKAPLARRLLSSATALAVGALTLGAGGTPVVGRRFHIRSVESGTVLGEVEDSIIIVGDLGELLRRGLVDLTPREFVETWMPEMPPEDR